MNDGVPAKSGSDPQSVSSVGSLPTSMASEKATGARTHKISRFSFNIFKNHRDRVPPKQSLSGNRQIQVHSSGALKFFVMTALQSEYLQQYPKLVEAVGAFNREKTRKNLNEIARQLEEISRNTPISDSPVLRQLRCEVSMQLLLLLNEWEGGIQLDNRQWLFGRVADSLFPDLKEDFLVKQKPAAEALRQAIIHLKEDRSNERFQAVVVAVSAYQEALEPMEIEGMEELIKCLSTAVSKDLLEESFILEEAQNRLEDGRLSLSKKTTNHLKGALKAYNRKPTFSAYQEIFKEYANWTYDTSRLQEKIRKRSSYIVYDRAYKSSMVENSRWHPQYWDLKKWNVLSLPRGHGQRPSEEMNAIMQAVRDVNVKKSSSGGAGAVQSLYRITEAWIEKEPEEFFHCGGQRLLNELQKNIVASVAQTSITKGLISRSKELEAVNEAIRIYNREHNLESLKAVEDAIMKWQTMDPRNGEIGEFSRYYGKELQTQINRLLSSVKMAKKNGKTASFPSLLLPTTHPSEVFAKDMALVNRADGKKTAYLMTFQDGYQYGGHTDIGFVRANPIEPKSFTSFQESEGKRLIALLEKQGMLEVKKNVNNERFLFLKPDWEKQLQLEKLDDAFKSRWELIVADLKNFSQLSEDNHLAAKKREYFAIGARESSLDKDSQHADGIRLTDERLTSRLEQISKRRRKELMSNFEKYDGAKPAAKSMVQGGYATLLVTQEDRLRHVRHALIDNFLTNLESQTFEPNFKEKRYRLEVFESEGKIHKKWVEDAQSGQFTREKNRWGKETYKRNWYVWENNAMHAAPFDRSKKRGHIVSKADGTNMWVPDDRFGQCYKDQAAGIEEAKRDDRPLYSYKHENILSKGEKEWCGSAVVRMLHSAYAFEHMPGFRHTVNGLLEDIKAMTGYVEGQSFEKMHVKALSMLVDAYTKKIVDSEEGGKYFRDMHPSVRLNPRSTPDMVHKFLMGQAPGLVNSAQRAWRIIKVPGERSSKQSKTSFSIKEVPIAFVKLVVNVIAATIGTVVDTFVTAPQQAVQRHLEKMSRHEEAGSKVRFKAVKLAGSAVYGFVKGGLIKRIGGQFLGIEDVMNSVKKTNRSAFA